MSAKEDLELTIRTATAIKALSQLVGARDMRLAKLMYVEAIGQIVEVGNFIDRCNAAGKSGSHDGV